MNTDEFWDIIHSSLAATHETQLDLLKNRLGRFEPQELIDFKVLFTQHLFAAYNWDLWVVAWLCQGGMCSDDGFTDFRSWLISRGRHTYQAALANPDSLIDEMRQTEHPFFESFAYVASETYRDMTGEDFPEFDFQHPKEPAGGDWLRPTLKDRSGSKMLNLCVVFSEMGEEEIKAIEQRFPRIWEHCVQRGIITTEPPAPSDLPTVQEIAATVDPTLEARDFGAYLKAVADAARQAYKKKE